MVMIFSLDFCCFLWNRSTDDQLFSTGFWWLWRRCWKQDPQECSCETDDLEVDKRSHECHFWQVNWSTSSGQFVYLIHHDPPCPYPTSPTRRGSWLNGNVFKDVDTKLRVSDGLGWRPFTPFRLATTIKFLEKNKCQTETIAHHKKSGKWRLTVRSYLFDHRSHRDLKTAQTFRVPQRLSHEFPKLFLMLDELRDACQNLGFLGWGLRFLMIAVYSQPWQPDQFSWLKTDFNMTNQENNITIYILHIS